MELTIDQALQEAVAAHKDGKLQDAGRLYRAILQAQPNHPDANHNLGLLAVAVGKPLEAVPFFKLALDASPNNEQFWRSCVETLVASGCEEGIIFATQFTQKFPRITSAWLCLGAALGKAGKTEESLDAFGQASKLSSDDAQVHYNLGVALTAAGKLKSALESYQRALALDPSHAASAYNSGNVLIRLENFEAAETAFKQVIQKNPHNVSASCNLAALLTKAGKPDEAVRLISESIAANQTHAKSLSNLGDALKELGELAQAELSYHKAVALDPKNFELHSNLAILSASMLFHSPSYLRDLRCFSDEVHSTITAPYSDWLVSKNSSDLRVGFVSGDFRAHPVGYFTEALLGELQLSSIEVFAYPTSASSDNVTCRIKPLFDAWRPLVGLSDDEAAEKIHGDGIHILIDLSGHTAKNRLPVFARKPAPIQVSWLGYFASTGLSEMDYILGDPYVTPHTEAEHFVETIWQLPESYLCFTPPSEDAKTAPLPASINGFITFGCFNNLARMTDEVVSVRAAILHAKPDSKLFLKDKQLDHEAGRRRVISRFAALGISADRLILEGRSPREEYLSCYNRVDIALSPFPYGGGTTSVEGLWMGVPVITKKGSHFLSHLGESIANNSGLSDWIAADEEDYIARAVAFASDQKSLSTLRKNMRAQILNTPLFDGPRFARHFEDALRAMRSKLC